jgi:hypothetical protein
MGIIGFVLLITLAFMGCSTPHNDGNGGDTKLAKIDISNATNLFIAPASNSRSAGRVLSDTTQKMFKITEDGYIQEVSYFDENGNTITDIQTPSDIYNVNNEYVVVCFVDDDGYLIKKSDGAVFSLKNIGIPDSFFQLKYLDTVQYTLNSIYYSTHILGNPDDEVINKIDIFNLNHLTATTIKEPSGKIAQFLVNPNGHMVYRVVNSPITRIRKSNSGFMNLPNNIDNFWLNSNGAITYFEYTDQNQYNVVSIDFDSNFEPIRSTTAIDFYTGGLIEYLLRFDDRIIAITDKIFEVENSSNTPREITITEIKTINNAIYSDDCYYLSGNNYSNQPVLLKINPKNDSVITLLAPNQYDIYKMTVDSNNVVSFNALRMSDGKKIIGRISSPDNVFLLDEEMDSEIVVLERIR